MPTYFTEGLHYVRWDRASNELNVHKVRLSRTPPHTEEKSLDLHWCTYHHQFCAWDTGFSDKRMGSVVAAKLVLNTNLIRLFQQIAHFAYRLIEDSYCLFSSNLSGGSHQKLKQLTVCCFRHHGNGPRRRLTANLPFSV